MLLLNSNVLQASLGFSKAYTSSSFKNFTYSWIVNSHMIQIQKVLNGMYTCHRAEEIRETWQINVLGVLGGILGQKAC